MRCASSVSRAPAPRGLPVSPGGAAPCPAGWWVRCRGSAPGLRLSSSVCKGPTAPKADEGEASDDGSSARSGMASARPGPGAAASAASEWDDDALSSSPGDGKRSASRPHEPRQQAQSSPRDHLISEDATRLAERMRKGSLERDRTRSTLWSALAANSLATALKAAVWLSTGSSAMFAETVHSAVDTANQAVLNRGHIEASFEPDVKHQYGYGKAQYVWGLVSAMGIMWMGAGVAVYRGIEALASPPVEAFTIPMAAWGALGASFLLDGYVLVGATTELARRAAAEHPEAFLPIREIAGRRYDEDGRVVTEANASMLAIAAATPRVLARRLGAILGHVRATRDTSVAAVFLEDAAGCAGVTIAAAGLLATQVTGDPTWDAVATLSIGALLGGVAIQLLERNRQMLLGEAVSPKMVAAITALVASRPAIDGVREVQSQWISPDTFAYKAEVDFDGTVLAARLLDDYQGLFLGAADLEAELPVLLSLYAEDVTRAVERELKATEADIRSHYPGAAFIELEPDSVAANERMSDRASSQEGQRGERRQLLASLLAQQQARALARGPSAEGRMEAAEEEARLREWFRRAELLGAAAVPKVVVTPPPTQGAKPADANAALETAQTREAPTADSDSPATDAAGEASQQLRDGGGRR